MTRRGWLWLALALLAFLLMGLDQLHMEKELCPLDTVSYFANAQEIRNAGGAFALLGRCLSGDYRTVNQMPLYLAMLSFLPVDRVEGLAWARLMTLAIGAVGIVVVFFVARRLFSRREAILAAALLAVNTAWLWHSTTTACETLLAIWITLLWLWMALYLRGRRTGLCIGLALGLALMTKGTAVLLLPAAGAVFLWKERARIFKSRQAWLAALGCLLVCSPILIRNVRVSGSPLHHVTTNIRGIWGGTRVESDTARYPTLRAYLKARGLAFAARRVIAGLPQMGIYALVGSGQTYVLSEKLHLKVWPVGVLMLLLMAAALRRKRDRLAAAPAIGMAAAFTLFFAWWYAKDMRYVMPLLPIGIILAARGFVCVAHRIARRARTPGTLPRLRWTVIPVAAALSAAILLAAASPNTRRNPIDSSPIPPGYFQLLQWLDRNVRNDTEWRIGISQVYVYYWRNSLPGKWGPIPRLASMEELQAYARENHVRYIVLDYSSLLDNDFLIGDWVRLEGEHIAVVRLPDNWREVFSAPGAVKTCRVFEITPS